MAKPRKSSPAVVRALGYIRVSTDQQVDSGAGMAAQETMLRTEAARNGWELELVVDAGLSGKDMKRPGLAEALARLDRGDADVLFSTKLDRVSRSVKDFAGLMERAGKQGWRVVLLDLGDVSSATGEMTANIIAAAAQYERRLIGQRTREGLAAKQAQGVRLGRPSAIPAEVVRRIVAERAAGKSLPKIAAGLTEDGVTTARGGKWHPSTIAAVLAGQDAAAMTA